MIVAADTSVVLNLCWLKQEALLASLYERVLAPATVRLEFERKVVRDPRFPGLLFPSFVRVTGPAAIPASLAKNPDLDDGEKAVIALAPEERIANVLVDEQSGRAVALSFGLEVSGLLGVLIEAKRRRLVPALKPLVDDLIIRARFWISPSLRLRVLRLAGEEP